MGLRLESQSFLYVWMEAEGEKHTSFSLSSIAVVHYLKHAAFQPQMDCNNGHTSLYVKQTKAPQRRPSSLASPPSPYFLIKFLSTTGYFISNFQAFWKTLNSHALRHCGCLISMQRLTLVWEWGVTKSLYLSLRRCFILGLLDYNLPLLLKMGYLSVDTSHPISMVLWIFLKFVARQELLKEIYSSLGLFCVHESD